MPSRLELRASNERTTPSSGKEVASRETEESGSFYLRSVSKGFLEKLNRKGWAPVCYKERRGFWAEGGRDAHAWPGAGTRHRVPGDRGASRCRHIRSGRVTSGQLRLSPANVLRVSCVDPGKDSADAMRLYLRGASAGRCTGRTVIHRNPKTSPTWKRKEGRRSGLQACPALGALQPRP